MGEIDLGIRLGQAAIESPLIKEAIDSAAGAAEKLFMDSAPKGAAQIADPALQSIQSIKFPGGMQATGHLNDNLTAGFAHMAEHDAHAYEAAAKTIGQSTGFISQPIERWATPEEMHRTAAEGSLAYVAGNAAGANSYTKFLTERFGSI